MSVTRLVLLAAESGSLDQVLGSELPEGIDVVVVSWDGPGTQARPALGKASLVIVGGRKAGIGESILLYLGGGALQRVMRRTPIGRLVDSVSPMHRSRRFAARVQQDGRWTPRPGDWLIALDNDAALLAWRTVRTMQGVTATLGLAAGLERLKTLPSEAA